MFSGLLFLESFMKGTYMPLKEWITNELSVELQQSTILSISADVFHGPWELCLPITDMDMPDLRSIWQHFLIGFVVASVLVLYAGRLFRGRERIGIESYSSWCLDRS